MKDRNGSTSLTRLCRLLGITPQAYYQHFWHQEAVGVEQSIVLQEVINIRKEHRLMGGRKLYQMLELFMLEHQVKMGRDALFDLLADHSLLVQRKRRKVYTTMSRHWLFKHKNLVREFTTSRPNELWVSDITYIKTAKGFLYLSLVTDVYSHKIVGYHIAQTLESVETLQALKMALDDNDLSSTKLIHHSDRGVQYCSGDYVKLLQDNNIAISMTENGDPLENAVAERINGIIKQEYMDFYPINNLGEARTYLQKAVYLYNYQRPHMSIGMLIPHNVHTANLKTEKLWKSRQKVIANPHSASLGTEALHEYGITF